MQNDSSSYDADTDREVSATTPAGTFSAHSAGAHVSQWDSTKFGPIIFNPSGAEYRVGVSPHGSIPICFPWFGDPTHPGKGVTKLANGQEVAFLGQSKAQGKHGFARFLNWHLVGEQTWDDGSWQVRYQLTDQDVPSSVCDDLAPFRAEYNAKMGESSARIALTVTNTGEAPFFFEEALHTYFVVSDLDQVSVEGLDGLTYVDTAVPGSPTDQLTLQRGPVTFGEMVDRIYPTDRDLVIVDEALERQIAIQTDASGTTIIWNPGPDFGPTLEDLEGDEWRRFICVETANARGSAIYLAPGKSHTIAANYKISRFEHE